jgi:hypothetical protein
MENGNNLIHSFNSTDYSQGNFHGLTKREYFAAMAMQAYVNNYYGEEDETMQAIRSVKMADALLAELDKPKSE